MLSNLRYMHCIIPICVITVIRVHGACGYVGNAWKPNAIRYKTREGSALGVCMIDPHSRSLAFRAREFDC